MKRTRKPLTKIQKEAKGKDCYLNLPGIHRTMEENLDVVLAHAPQAERGGMRKDDHWGCPSCGPCHSAADGRGEYIDPVLMMETWFYAVPRWQKHLMTKRLMKVEGIEPRPPTVRDF